MSNKQNPSMLWGQGSDTSILRKLPLLFRSSQRAMKYVPFVLPAAVGISWLLFPALTPGFKHSIGIGPKPKE